MIAPYAHVATLEESDPAALGDDVARAAVGICAAVDLSTRRRQCRNERRKGGGSGSGSDIFTCTVLPRWLGDVNFMTSIGETRVLRERTRCDVGEAHQEVHHSMNVNEHNGALAIMPVFDDQDNSDSPLHVGSHES